MNSGDFTYCLPKNSVVLRDLYAAAVMNSGDFTHCLPRTVLCQEITYIQHKNFRNFYFKVIVYLSYIASLLYFSLALSSNEER